jgi:hypothetical protein
MLSTLGRIGLMAAFLGLLFVPGAALAQPKEGRARHVHDEAKLFSKEAIEQANKTIDKIKKAHGKDLYIETVESGEKNKDDRNKWAKSRFNEFGIDGIYIVVSKNPGFYRYFVGNNTREKGYFTTADIEKMNETLKQISKEGKRDQTLNEVASFVLERMNEHARTKGEATPKKKGEVAQQPVGGRQDPVRHEPGAAPQKSEMPPWVGWVCIIVAVLFVVWIIFAIIRAMTSMGGGGYGGGYGGGGYGYGGGGGLFTGMLGGLFGAMAGMWIYNHMFGGHATYAPNGGVNWGGDQGATGSAAEPYQSDTADGGTVGGGDDDAGGGGDDAGGGGGDWGGGGDAGDAGGGGGDWGGGGGDAGGGDWGGGGDAGGDWGGGGGDWGGGGGDFGGGGGDW